jgi:DNA-binding MarR family transcriptional regulator
MGEPDHIEAADDELLTQAGQALFRLGRVFGRPATGRQPRDQFGRPVERSRIQVVQAVAAYEADPAHDAIGVGAIAEALGVDPSTASRLVAETIRDGYLSRATVPGDARRARLALTPTGRALVADASTYQRAVFARLTQGWPAVERARFAAQFVAFAAAIATLLDEDEATAAVGEG